MSKPLEGVRVLDLSHVIAGPLASFYLAQMGAEVIKIESPEGEVMRAAGGNAGAEPSGGFVALNAGKRSLSVDIRTPEGAALVRKLAGTADVFIENFRPGTVAKYGLDEASIRAERPDIVYCSISGYGQQGDWATRGAYDHVVQALTGMMMMSGGAGDDAPVKVGFPVIDVAVGLLGALSVTAALHRRSRDGTGQTIDASMVQAALMLMYPQASAFLTDRVDPPRAGNRGYTGSPTADTYRCLDGWLATAANTPAQFRKLTAVLDMEDICDDGNALDLVSFNAPGAAFVVAKDLPYLQKRFHEAFAQTSAADMETRLNAVGVPAARVRRLGEFLDEVESTGHIPLHGATFTRGEKVVRTPGLGFAARDDSAQTQAPAPQLGQDTISLLEGIGLSGAAIADLQRTGVVRATGTA